MCLGRDWVGTTWTASVTVIFADFFGLIEQGFLGFY